LSTAQTPSAKHSPSLAEARPVSVGVFPERLARIEVMCQQAVADGDVPGVVALVARHGETVFHEAFGYADNTARRELRRDDSFRIAAQSKAITATAVMLLWEAGRFRLDDPVASFIPAFKDAQVLRTYNDANGTWTGEPARTRITIRHLLTHT
jgi:CubicO group peptidase (beta-lactamase class C family)